MSSAIPQASLAGMQLASAVWKQLRADRESTDHGELNLVLAIHRPLRSGSATTGRHLGGSVPRCQLSFKAVPVRRLNCHLES